ncbi:MAG: hypothetical protein ACREI9_02060 [Nitrospiraceae bacterium]
MTPHDVCQKFNSIHWHDSKLLNLEIGKNSSGVTEEVRFDVQLLINPVPGNYKWEPRVIIFRECRLVQACLDLQVMRMCSHDISSAECVEDSPLKKEFERQIENEPLKVKPEKNPLANSLQFTISLIPPSGRITIFAKDFDVVPPPSIR